VTGSEEDSVPSDEGISSDSTALMVGGSDCAGCVSPTISTTLPADDGRSCGPSLPADKVPGTVGAASGEVPRPSGLVGTDEFPARRLEPGSVTSSTLNSRYTTMRHASELKYDVRLHNIAHRHKPSHTVLVAIFQMNLGQQIAPLTIFHLFWTFASPEHLTLPYLWGRLILATQH